MNINYPILLASLMIALGVYVVNANGNFPLGLTIWLTGQLLIYYAR